MSSVAPRTRPAARRIGQMQVTAYDRFSGWLISLLILVGFFVLLLFLIWLTSVFSWQSAAVPATYIDDLKGRGEHAEGVARDLEEPGVEELADVPEPQLADTLAAVTDAVSSQAAALEALEGNAAEMGTGSGLGDSRMTGPGGEGDTDIKPPWERWELLYSTKSMQEYARQLDFFKVELAAMDTATPDVHYLRNMSTKAVTRVGQREDEGRLYFIHKQQVLRAWDETLMKQAGVVTKRRIVLQLYPNDLIPRLAAMERAKLGGRRLEDVAKTVFAVRSAGAGYEFYVQEIRFAGG